MGEKRLARRLAALVAGAVALTAAGGCGGDDDGGASTASAKAQVEHVRADRYTYARKLFNELCAGCHTLADAGARGQRYDLDKSPNLSAAQVWNAIQNGEPGMPPWRELSEREVSALAVYITNVARREEGEERWGVQIARRNAGETKRWKRIAATIERELEREGRQKEGRAGRVTAPEERAGG